jgi:hypothetical protein
LPLKKLASSLTALSCRALREQRSVALDPLLRALLALSRPPHSSPRTACPPAGARGPTVTKRYLHLGVVCTYLAQRSAWRIGRGLK